MNRTQFMNLCSAGKGNTTPAEYRDNITAEDQFGEMVNRIMGNNLSWEEVSGRTKKKAPEPKLEGKEEKIRDFFKNNSFDTTNQMRLFAEAFSIIEGVDALRFMVTSSKAQFRSKDHFPEFITIVPIGNDNDHNYKLGEPIICLERGTSFIKMTGNSGNSMSRTLGCYRMATQEETELILWTVLYKNEGLVAYVVHSLVEEDE